MPKTLPSEYEYDGHTGLPKCKCCGRIDTDLDMYEDDT